MVKYYKKLTPRNPVIFQPGHITIKFESFDGLIGYYATDSQMIQDYFLRMMREQRYGITEISAEEYQRDFLEKKTSLNPSSPSRWREEMSGSSVRPTGYDPVSVLGAERVEAAVAVKGGNDMRKEPAIRMDPSAPGHEAPQKLGGASGKAKPQAAAAKYVPNVGKRRKKASESVSIAES